MSEAAQEMTTAERPRRGRPRGSESAILHHAIVKEAKSGRKLSKAEIADKVGCNRNTVAEVLSKYGIKQTELEEYRENQADVLLGLQHRISKSIDDECIQKGTLKDRIVALGIMYDKHRLQTNQSTQNIASLHSIAERAIKAVSIVNDQNPPEGINTSNAGSVTDND